MDPIVSTLILADLPTGTGYVNLIKVAVVVVLLLTWAYVAQWVDKDTDVVKTKREPWNMIVCAGAAVGFFVLFVVPWHGALCFVGVGVWLLIAGGAAVFYLLHRNRRVLPDARVLTVTHIRRLVLGDQARKRGLGKDLRVQITDHTGKFVETPTDPVEAVEYHAVQDFLYDMLWRRASDLEMLAGKDRYRLVYHIDGVPSEQPEGVTIENGEQILRFLKRVAGVNVEEIRRPQVGRIQTALLSSEESEAGFTEVHTSGSTAGERLRLHVQAGPALMRMHELGLAPQRIESLRTVLGKSTGLFLITSPPGNGATTTQYAIVRSHDAYIHNIHALERRSMVDLDNITQHLYDGAQTDVSYARTLQTMLRREPDIVLVADCDDRDTVQLAVRAAATDRKVYLGMQAKDTFAALTKYLTFAGDNQLAAKGLLGVLNQRLVRRLCSECREAFKPDAATLKKLNLPVEKIECFYRPPSEPKVDRKGRRIDCPKCRGTGYVGRTGVFELLVVDPGVAKLIAEGAAINKIKALCRKNRMYYLQEEGLLKVIDGITSMNEVLRILRDSEKQG
jgi:type II secretory ATPase GspE/PulE/Tfp pilus assembly ATPase PilB-like protein